MDKLKEAVEIKRAIALYKVNDNQSRPYSYEEEADADNVLLDLAEKVLAVDGKMPEKIDTFGPKDSRGSPYFVIPQNDICLCFGRVTTGGMCAVCGKKK